MPILEDLYNELLCQSEPEAKHIASSLELYVHGSLNVFKAEIENLQIVKMVKAVNMDNKTLTEFLKAYAKGEIKLPNNE